MCRPTGLVFRAGVRVSVVPLLELGTTRQSCLARRSVSSSSASSSSARPTPKGSPISRLRLSRPSKRGVYTLISLSVSVAGLVWGIKLSDRQDEFRPQESQLSSSITQIPTTTLLRSYLVWTLLSIPALVDASPTILPALLHTSLPLLPSLTEAFVRRTFFAQFIPGESALECLPTLEALRRRNVGSALNYSAEADGHGDQGGEDMQERRYEEVLRAMGIQGEMEARLEKEGWSRGSSAFALKVSGITSPDVLERASTALLNLRATPTSSPTPRSKRIGSDVPYPGFPTDEDARILAPRVDVKGPRAPISDLVQGDVEKLQLLWERLDGIAAKAQKNGVKLILDAEETWFSPAIDGYALLLSMKYNRPADAASAPGSAPGGPVIYGTYQSYLQRQPAYLQAALDHASKHGYALGLKVVRGGYIVKERAAGEAAGKGGNGAVWPTKALTDTSYNGSIETILETLARQTAPKGRKGGRRSAPVPTLSVIFGTHNTDSVASIINTLETKGLATRTSDGKLRLKEEVRGRVGIAQLYGMREDLSDLIQSTFELSDSPISYIYIAYGTLRETMPFLSRRATENKSVMNGEGGAAFMRRRAGQELQRRIRAMISLD